MFARGVCGLFLGVVCFPGFIDHIVILWAIRLSFVRFLCRVSRVPLFMIGHGRVLALSVLCVFRVVIMSRLNINAQSHWLVLCFFVIHGYLCMCAFDRVFLFLARVRLCFIVANRVFGRYLLCGWTFYVFSFCSSLGGKCLCVAYVDFSFYFYFILGGCCLLGVVVSGRLFATKGFDLCCISWSCCRLSFWRGLL